MEKLNKNRIADWPELQLFKEKAEQELRERRKRSEKISAIAILISVIALIVQITVIWK